MPDTSTITELSSRQADFSYWVYASLSKKPICICRIWNPLHIYVYTHSQAYTHPMLSV